MYIYLLQRHITNILSLFHNSNIFDIISESSICFFRNITMMIEKWDYYRRGRKSRKILKKYVLFFRHSLNMMRTFFGEFHRKYKDIYLTHKLLNYDVLIFKTNRFILDTYNDDYNERSLKLLLLLYCNGILLYLHFTNSTQHSLMQYSFIQDKELRIQIKIFITYTECH